MPQPRQPLHAGNGFLHRLPASLPVASANERESKEIMMCACRVDVCFINMCAFVRVCVCVCLKAYYCKLVSLYEYLFNNAPRDKCSQYCETLVRLWLGNLLVLTEIHTQACNAHTHTHLSLSLSLFACLFVCLSSLLLCSLYAFLPSKPSLPPTTPLSFL